MQRKITAIILYSYKVIWTCLVGRFFRTRCIRLWHKSSQVKSSSR